MQHFVLEQALNLLIQNGSIDIKPLESKVIRFTLIDLLLDVNFICTNNRIFVNSDTSAPSDVEIKLRPNVFFALFKGEDLTDLLRQDKIHIHGDVKTAQLLVDLLSATELDLEELLSQYTGDIVAHEMGKTAKKIKQVVKQSPNPLEALKDGLSELLIQPKVSKKYTNPRH